MKAAHPVQVKTRRSHRPSLFVSHHVETHKCAAARIKELLESRTEHLDVHICEDIDCGENWLNWIVSHISKSKILLVLVPRGSRHFAWIEKEIRLFKKNCPRGHLVIVNPENNPIPEFAKNLQIVKACREDLRKCFLEPLFSGTIFGRPNSALNSRISAADLDRDACDIRNAILGERSSREFGESLIVDIGGLDLTVAGSLDQAIVEAPVGCEQILNWRPNQRFLWRELRERAEKEKGKGTFWVKEMAAVIQEVADQNVPRVMSSTFRGRGAAGGRIFRPQLTRVEAVDNRPVSLKFVFYEVLVPESVRGPELIGDVYNLLRLAGRLRWEVLHPFLEKCYLASASFPAGLKLGPEEQADLIGRVSNSLRAIELEAERHDTLAKGKRAFEGEQFEMISEMIDERSKIKKAIAEALNRNDFDELMRELIEALDLNSQVMEFVANRFLELTRKDRESVKQSVAAARAAQRAKAARAG